MISITATILSQFRKSEEGVLLRDIMTYENMMQENKKL